MFVLSVKEKPLYHSPHKEFLFVVYSLISSCVLNLHQSYQCHSLQTLQQEGHVAYNLKLQTNPLGLFPQNQIYLILIAIPAKI